MKALMMVFLFFMPFLAAAMEMRLVQNGSNVDVRIFELDLPMEQLEKDIKSGLSTILVATLITWKKNKLNSKVVMNLKIRYDLWDEAFYLQKTMGKDKSTQKMIKKSEVLNFVKSYTFPAVLSLEELRGNNEISFAFGLVMDPISKEKRQKVKKWLAQNQVSIPSSQPQTVGNSSSQATESSPPSVEPTTKGAFNRGLFGQLLDSELGSGVDSGKWTYLSQKKSMSIKDLTNEK